MGGFFEILGWVLGTLVVGYIALWIAIDRGWIDFK